MSISLNNHESRIAALETNKGSSSWTKGSNSNGYWAKDGGSGLIIQWGRVGRNGINEESGSTNFPISFTSSSSYSMAAIQTNTANGATGSWSERIRNITNATFYWWTNCGPMHWIAIGI